MRIFIVTAFPKIFDGPFSESILKRAMEKGLVDINVVDLREFSTDKHHKVDDYPFGGGPGMVMKPEPFFRAVEAIKEKERLSQPHVIMMTPQGRTYDQEAANRLSQQQELIFLCGHYKAVDQRVHDFLADEEISIGDYILTGGELAALVVVDSVVRLLPGAIGDRESANTDSFARGLLDCPYYTRPENFRGMTVPEILLSGHHAEIERWRLEQARNRTKKRRKDLLERLENQTTH
ncbi:MAG: tRNA (guanosine(37)-N1)-methyltransferase TrmD [Calditrichaeota bacterium]|nr:MAG: tRNA (guanosine(37)-N1)-methyltransferase TrmD [Calditrichota bacterium]